MYAIKNFTFLKYTGFSLIEVLVAVVVLSIGLLGLAGLHITSLQNNHSAYLRNQATLQAYDMADRIRTNLEAAKNGYYNNPTVTQHLECKTSSGCSPQQMAENDAFDWSATIATLLLSGAGVVCIDSTPDDGTPADPQCDNVGGSPYVVKVWWDDNRSGNLMRFVTSFQP